MRKYSINYNTDTKPEEHKDLLKLVKLAAKDTGLKGRFEVSCNLINSNDIRAINLEHRGKDKSTDVLSFPQMSTFEGSTDLGDVFINTDILQSQAALVGQDASTELKFLFMHGLLHLIGHDHQTDEEYELMKSKEEEYFSKAKIRKYN